MAGAGSSKVRWLAVAACASVALWFGARSSGVGGEAPRARLGCLPFPGPMTLWCVADPDDVGRRASAQRGILYTCRAGFIDLAHLRETADWTRFVHDRVRVAFERGERAVTFSDGCGAEYRLELADPAGGERGDDAAARRERAATLIAQRASYLVQVWHEAATWFGARTVPFIPEDRSSFTYDDGVAHVLGVRLAAAALDAVNARRSPSFEDALDDALARELARLRAVHAADTIRATDAVRGRWWRDGTCVKRQMDVGLDTGVVVPWIVAGIGLCDECPAEPQALPWFDPEARRVLDDALLAVRMRGAFIDAATRAESETDRAGEAPWLAADDVLRTSLRAVHDAMDRLLGRGFDDPSAIERP
ncbi:MAG: DUF4056 domain-containing protein [Phycisphaerales bacterium]